MWTDNQDRVEKLDLYANKWSQSSVEMFEPGEPKILMSCHVRHVSSFRLDKRHYVFRFEIHAIDTKKKRQS
jgi:hypothetical protein